MTQLTTEWRRQAGIIRCKRSADSFRCKDSEGSDSFHAMYQFDSQTNLIQTESNHRDLGDSFIPN
jgi:hypothetical protein